MSENILQNKNCLITGATGGIGKEIAKCLAKKRCNLFLTGRSKEKLEEIYNEIKSDEIKISYHAADLSKNEERQKLIEVTRHNFHEIDILINCAGKFLIKSILESTLEDFESSFNVNVKVPFILTKEFVNDMISNKWGRIINIGSSSSYAGFTNGTIYSGSKHAILGISRALYLELKEKNVRVLCLSPGSTKTDMAKISTDQDFETFLDPKEVAKFVEFLISFDNELVVEEIRLNRMEIR